MKACCVYKTEKEFKIITESETDIGLFISDDPVFILPIISDVEDVKCAIFECLNSSRKGIYTPKPDEWKEWQKKRLKKMKEKSYTSLEKRSNYVGIRLEKNILIIYPGKYTHRQGFGIVEKDIVKMEYSFDDEIEITRKIIEMLGIDYKKQEMIGIPKKPTS